MGVVTLLILLTFTLLPLVGGIWLIVLSRGGKGYPACGGCAYDLSHTVGTEKRCPECGGEFVKVGINPPRSRNRGMLTLGIVLLIIPVTCAGGLMLSSVVAFRASTAQQQALIRAQSAAPPPAPAPTTVTPVEPTVDGAAEAGGESD